MKRIIILCLLAVSFLFSPLSARENPSTCQVIEAASRCLEVSEEELWTNYEDAEITIEYDGDQVIIRDSGGIILFQESSHL